MMTWVNCNDRNRESNRIYVPFLLLVFILTNPFFVDLYATRPYGSLTRTDQWSEMQSYAVPLILMFVVAMLGLGYWHNDGPPHQTYQDMLRWLPWYHLFGFCIVILGFGLIAIVLRFLK